MLPTIPWQEMMEHVYTVQYPFFGILENADIILRRSSKQASKHRKPHLGCNFDHEPPDFQVTTKGQSKLDQKNVCRSSHEASNN